MPRRRHVACKVQLVTAPPRPPRVERAEYTPLAEQARERIRASILDGTLRPGERLTIEQLALEIGVSRTPVREALKALEQDGMVRLLPHRGAVVDAVAHEEVHRRYTIRAMLEGYAAELSCRANAKGIAPQLESICVELEKVARSAKPKNRDATRRMSELNQQFHGLIRDGCESRTLVRLLEGLRNPISYTYSHWESPERRQESLESHRAIMTAFKNDDPEAARSSMEQHILAARDTITHPEEESPPSA